MDTTTKSGLYYPNKLVLVTFNALTDVMGKNGLNAILNYAHLREYISQYPSENLDRGFDFADFSAIQGAIVEMYGEKGGQTFIKRAGRYTFKTCLSKQGALAGVTNDTFRSLPVQTRLRIGLQALAKIFSQISDQTTTIEEDSDYFRYVVKLCPECWGRHGTEKVTCSFGVGLLEEGLNYISGGGEYRVIETTCMAKGDEACMYSIDKNLIIS
jgi:predicted hydrocarbon binding protein